MKVHILDDWFDTLRGLQCFAKLDGHEVTVWTDHVEDVDVLAARLQEAEGVVLFRERTKVTRALLEKLPNLRLISQRGTYPHIDVQACTDHGVMVCSKAPSGGSVNYAAAELTWALIMMGMRGLPGQMASVKAGRWQSGVGKTLRGRRLGLYGYGRIAKAVATYADAFGMETVWWASEAGRKRAQAEGARVAENRAAFFASCDVISVHLRLNDQTRGIISFDDLNQMSSESLFVNTSRAGLVTTDALIHALEQGRPGLAAVDVFDIEPLLDPMDRLLSHPNLIATPHIGFATEDEYEKQFSDIFDQIVAFANGQPINVIEAA